MLGGLDFRSIYAAVKQAIGVSSISTVDSIAALKAMAPPSSAITVLVRGFAAVGDGGGGSYYWSAGDATADDGGTVIQLNAGGAGRFRFVGPTGIVDARVFGAKCDGVTDDSTALQNAVNSLSTNGGLVLLPISTNTTRCLFATAITIPDGVGLQGAGKYATVLRYSGTGTAFAPAGAANFKKSTFRDFTLQLTGNNAIGFDYSTWYSVNMLAVRIQNPSGAAGQTGINANITNVAWQSYFNVFNDVTFDSLALGVNLAQTVAQRANRWRFIAPTFINGTDGMHLSMQGIQVWGASFSEITGFGFTVNAAATHVILTDTDFESNVGGTLFSINAAANRTEIKGYKVHAGTDGSGAGIGLRGFLIADWDTGIRWSGSATATAISTLAVSGETGLQGTGVASFSGIGTANVAVTGWAGKETALSYGVTVNTDASTGRSFTITPNNGTAFTIAAPTNPTTGQRITYMVRNASGGALGAVTWNAVFKLAAWTSPANGFSRSIDFRYDGTNWVEVGRTTVDVTN